MQQEDITISMIITASMLGITSHTMQSFMSWGRIMLIIYNDQYLENPVAMTSIHIGVKNDNHTLQFK